MNGRIAIKEKSFSDLWSEGDYQGAFGSAFLDAAESAATSAAIAATGGAGLVAAGLTTASDKYDELSRENPEMGETLKWANAIGTGAAESLSEAFWRGDDGPYSQKTSYRRVVVRQQPIL